MSNVTPFDFGSADLKKIADEAQEMELLFDDEPIGVFLSVRGKDSATFREAARKEANALRRREFEAQRKGRRASVRTIEDDEEEGVELIATLLAGWRTVRAGKSEPVIYDNGKAIEFSEAAVVEWLTKYDWVIPQISEFASEVGNFTKVSSKASPPSRASNSA